MYKTIEINDMSGILELLKEQHFRPDLNRHRSLHIYRGMPNVDYRLRNRSIGIKQKEER